jgi:titin
MTNDSGAGSLRQAILDANADHGPDTIAFAIGGGGVQTIRPTSPLPTITAAVTIDGTTQPGYAGTPLIVLNGDNARVSGNNGLTITGGNSVVKGLVVNGFFNAGILMCGGGGNVIAGNYIGTDVSGTSAVFNTYGVDVKSSGNTIGGTTLGSRNLISGSIWEGVVIEADHNVVEGNYIGTDVTGVAALPNRSDGVILLGTYNTVGGAANGSRNVISGNQGSGVYCGYAGAHHNVVEGNFIGTDATGTIALGNGREGVTLYGANNTVGGTTVSACNLISGNVTAGVRIKMMGADQNVVEGNYIGTDVTGNLALGNPVGVDIADGNDTTIGGTVPGAGNLISGNDHGIDEKMAYLNPRGTLVQGNFIGTNAAGTRAVGNGVGLNLGGLQDTVGGTAAAARNVISGNSSYGITAAPGSGALIQGNYIGTDATGNAALGNGIGIYGSAGFEIGGSTAGAGNVISGNTAYGIRLIHAGGQIQGNRIGTDAAGTAAVGNGVGISVGGFNDTVGGTLAGAGNVISGNRGAGIMSSGGSLVEGNRIGTDSTGTYALANGGDGIDSFGYDVIGGTTPGAGNLISGNTGNGIGVVGNFGSDLVQGNLIGVDASGTNALGNGGHGVLVSGFGGSTVGGTVAGAGNVIAFNGGDGVRVDASSGNAVRGNAIYGHTEGLGISLVHFGNYDQPAPVLTAARSRASGTNVTGTLTARISTRFTLEFFSNTDCNPSGYGEGRVFLGTLAVMTNAAGTAGFKTSLDAVVGPGQYLTATATDPNGNTSGFSQCLAVRTHGHQGNTAGVEAPPSDVGAAVGFRIDAAAAFGVAVGRPVDVGCKLAGWDVVARSPDVDAVPRIAGAGESLAVRLGSDLFFSSLDRDGADDRLASKASAIAGDGAWGSVLDLMGEPWGLPG